MINGDRIARCLIFCTFALVLWVDIAVGETFYMDMMHKYSSEFRAEMQSRNGHVATDWPIEGTREYYDRLINHDRHRHRNRELLGSNGSYSLAPSNETIELDNLGGLHYTVLELGTPNVSFVVALDTGSDLLWVPCQCKQCAPTDSSVYGFSHNFTFSIYDTSSSQTSKAISCSDKMCESTISPNSCTDGSQNCSYVVNYLQKNTSTSGILVQDVLYLNSESLGGKSMSTSIYFGCGEEQTGAFLNGGAPNGLLGLGQDKISIPSTLSRSGLVSNSFSMCFSSIDTSGRLVFGNKGRSDLQSTPLVPSTLSIYYVATTKAVVEDEVLSLSHDFIIDTGSSYTLMPQASLDSLGTIFNKKISLTPFQQSGLFDYCWNISDTQAQNITLPVLTLVFSGGSNMTILSPFVLVGDPLELVCLGIIGSTTAIIAHNFMQGYEIFFDRDSTSLSWSSTNCSYPNGDLPISPEASFSQMSPEGSPTPDTPPATSPSVPSTPSITPGIGTPSPTSNCAHSKSFNALLFLTCTIIITYNVLII